MEPTATRTLPAATARPKPPPPRFPSALHADQNDEHSPPVQQHVNLTLEGTRVFFPFEPYQVQRDYMSCVLRALTTGANAMLESPTGTGKTLSLLCATLAWQQAQPNAQKALIYYTSRTHMQLAQAANELKKTAYSRNPAVVMASRSQMCLNEEVRSQCHGGDHLINRACRNAIAKNACSYYTNYEQKLESMHHESVHDIEDLAEFGRRHQCCPYYASKKLADVKATVIFMPYNYLLDTSLHKSMTPKLENSVVIFDEAHNIESTLKDAVSGSFTQSCLKTVEESCRMLPEKLSQALMRESHGLTRSAFDDEKRANIEEKRPSNKKSKSKSEKEPKKNPIEELSSLLTNDKLQQVNMCAQNLAVELDRVEPPDVKEDGRLVGIERIYAIFLNSGVSYQTSDSIITTLDAMSSFWSMAGVMNVTMVARFVTAVVNLSNVITLLFPKQNLSLTRQVEHEKKVKKFYTAYLKSISAPTNVVRRGEREDWELNLWCLHAAIGLNRVIDSTCMRGPRSIIITSGTLAPFEPVVTELAKPFSVIKGFNHVINDDQFKILNIGISPERYSLISHYEASCKDQYLQAIGKSLLALFKVLPFGTLVFFPSYALKERCVKNWKDRNNIWREFNATTRIFEENKKQEIFFDELRKYKRAIDDKKTAVFLGVCRGKLSEGTNLPDNYCRNVIITGLPFPNISDPRIKATQEFHNKRLPCGGKYWYTEQMRRALNQTIGRVIRSKDDFGMLFLCDPRFQQMRYNLSEWIRRFYPQEPSEWGQVDGEVKSFYEHHGVKIDRSTAQSAGAFDIELAKVTKAPTAHTASGSQSKNAPASLGSQSSQPANGAISSSNSRLSLRLPPLFNSTQCSSQQSTQSTQMSKSSASTNSSYPGPFSKSAEEELPPPPPVRTAQERQAAMVAMYKVDKPTFQKVRERHKEMKAIQAAASESENILSNAQTSDQLPRDTFSAIYAQASGSGPRNSNSQPNPANSTPDVSIRLPRTDYSILEQLKDVTQPVEYKCCICLNKCDMPRRTNCPCARVGCSNCLKVLNGKKCGKCGTELHKRNFNRNLFKSAIFRRDRFVEQQSQGNSPPPAKKPNCNP